MKVLVTGGTGFLGKRLALRLQRLGCRVTVLGRNATVGQELEAQGIAFLRVNITEPEAVIRACTDQEVVFHCAALSSPWGKAADFHRINVLGTRSVAEGCLRHGVNRLIYVSSPSIYFDGADRLQIKESDPLPETSVNAYTRTKRLAEDEVDWATAQGLPVITLRPRALFGPGDRTILPRLIRANQRFGVPLIDGGQAMIDLTYIDNAVDALMTCLYATIPRAAGNITGAASSGSAGNTALLTPPWGCKYNISNGTPVRLKPLLQTLFRKLDVPFKPLPLRYPVADGIGATLEILSKTLLFGREPILTRYSVGVLAKSQTLDISAAQADLGYRPVIGIDEGLDLFADWWKQRHGQSKGRR